MGKFQVFINDIEVGFASAVDVDQPWFSAAFDALPSFTDFEPLFERLHHAYEDKQNDDVNRLSSEVQRLQISLVHEGGIFTYATHPTHDRATPISAVRIHAGMICWRPGKIDTYAV